MKSSLIIKGLTPGLTESGKIKIGEKGRMVQSRSGTQFQPPTKLDHFRVTSLERGPDGNYITDMAVHRLYGDRPRALPVRLLYDEIDLNFQCRYACFRGRTLWCTGDGEFASRAANGNGHQEVPCPCGRQDPAYTGEDRCKINARLSVIIDGMDRVGGVWVLRSTSYNTTVGILSSLALIKRITGGPLAGLPLELTLNPKTVVTPDGKIQTVWVVGLEFKGTIQQLQQIGLDQAKRDAVHYARIERIEHEARALLTHDPLVLETEPDDIVEEFYPEQARKGPEAIDGQPAPSGPSKPDVNQEDQAKPEETTKQQETGKSEERLPPEPKPQAPPSRRSRRNSFEVDPNDWDGKTELATCGCTPEQILSLRGLAKDPGNRVIVKEYLAGIGYDQLSFLRKEEAEDLIARLSGAKEPVPPANGNHVEAPPVPDDLVECPVNGGDKLSKSAHCLTDCEHRKRDGFCVFAGDPIPHSEAATI
jgi:hypothetical protein